MTAPAGFQAKRTIEIVDRLKRFQPVRRNRPLRLHTLSETELYEIDGN